TVKDLARHIDMKGLAPLTPVEGTPPTIATAAATLPIGCQITPSVRRCEKLASWRDGRRNSLPHLPCCPKVCKMGGAGGFACRAICHTLSAGGRGAGETVPSLTLGVIWQPKVTG